MRERLDERTDHQVSERIDQYIYSRIIDTPQARIIALMQKYIVNSSFIFDQLIQH